MDVVLHSFLFLKCLLPILVLRGHMTSSISWIGSKHSSVGKNKEWLIVVCCHWWELKKMKILQKSLRMGIK